VNAYTPLYSVRDSFFFGEIFTPKKAEPLLALPFIAER
jgi:hypothetical protein